MEIGQRSAVKCDGHGVLHVWLNTCKPEEPGIRFATGKAADVGSGLAPIGDFSADRAVPVTRRA